MGTYRGEAVRVSHRRSPWAVVLLNSLAGPLMQDSSEGKGQSAKLGMNRPIRPSGWGLKTLLQKRITKKQ